MNRASQQPNLRAIDYSTAQAPLRNVPSNAEWQRRKHQEQPRGLWARIFGGRAS